MYLKSKTKLLDLSSDMIYGKVSQIKDNHVEISEEKFDFFSLKFQSEWKIIDLKEYLLLRKEMIKNREVIILSNKKIIGKIIFVNITT